MATKKADVRALARREGMFFRYNVDGMILVKNHNLDLQGFMQNVSQDHIKMGKKKWQRNNNK